MCRAWRPIPGCGHMGQPRGRACYTRPGFHTQPSAEVSRHSTLLKSDRTSKHGALPNADCSTHVHAALRRPANLRTFPPVRAFEMLSLRHLACILVDHKPSIREFFPSTCRQGNLASKSIWEVPSITSWRSLNPITASLLHQRP